jgi:hypothetical protein
MIEAGMSRRAASLASPAVLASLVGSAVAAALAAACGSGGSGSAFGDGDSVDAAQERSLTCPSQGIVSSVQEMQPDGAPGGWVTSYGIDRTCCQAQLAQVVSGNENASITQGCEFAVEVPCPVDIVDAEAQCSDWCSLVAAGSTSGELWSRYPQAADGGGAFTWCVHGSGCGTGRPPRGFVPRLVPAATALGASLVRMAQLEHASVAAFDALHADLVRLAAPASLLRSVRAARRDEVRHALLAAREAARHGAVSPRVVVAPIAPRSLEALAIDNAEEGCVVETYGAALLALQAKTAKDPRLRRMLRSIAADELRHAALSWRIAAWLDARLDVAERTRVAGARTRAIASLERKLAVPAHVSDPLGTPGTVAPRALLRVLRNVLETGQLQAA